MTLSKPISMFRWHVDRVAGGIVSVFALLSGGVVLLIAVFLFMGAWPAISTGQFGGLFTDLHWQPGSVRDPQHGVVAMLVASLLVAALAILLAGPVGIAGAIYHRFYAPRFLERWHRRVLELLAGVPSVVFGFWGLTVLVPLINRIHPPGQSLLAGGLVLGVMILPLVALTSESALRSVPFSQLQAAAGLGLGRARTIWHVALPAARGGIGGGVLLAIARAIGETMAVVMVCGNISQFPGSLFDPVRPVTSTIALEMGYASDSHRALLFSAGLVLVVVTGTLGAWLAFRQKGSGV